MKINRLSFLKTLDAVRAGLSNNDKIEQGSNFVFSPGFVVTYNDEVCATAWNKEIDFTAAVPSATLFALVSKIRTEEIEVTMTDNELRVEAGKTKAGIAIQKDIKLPYTTVEEAMDWVDLPKGFAEELANAAAVAGTSTTMPILMCVHITEGGDIESSDSRRIYKTNVGEINGIPNVIFPATSATIVSRLHPTAICVTRSWVHFQNADGAQLSCRTFNKDKFPGLAVHCDFDGDAFLLPTGLGEALERAGLFSGSLKADEALVQITLDGRKCYVRNSTENGWIQEELNIRYNGPTVVFTIVAQLLQWVIGKTENCVLGKDRIRFDGDVWTYVSVLNKVK